MRLCNSFPSLSLARSLSLSTKMASLQHPTASLQSKHVLIPEKSLSQKLALTVSFPRSTLSALKLKLAVAIHRSNDAASARMSATVASSYAQALTVPNTLQRHRSNSNFRRQRPSRCL